MNLACNLREIRGKRSLSEIESSSGINRATLSQIERGVLLPLDKHVEALERAYGAPLPDWYPASVWAAMALGRDQAEA